MLFLFLFGNLLDINFLLFILFHLILLRNLFLKNRFNWLNLYLNSFVLLNLNYWTLYFFLKTLFHLFLNFLDFSKDLHFHIILALKQRGHNFNIIIAQNADIIFLFIQKGEF